MRNPYLLFIWNSNWWVIRILWQLQPYGSYNKIATPYPVGLVFPVFPSRLFSAFLSPALFPRSLTFVVLSPWFPWPLTPGWAQPMGGTGRWFKVGREREVRLFIPAAFWALTWQRPRSMLWVTLLPLLRFPLSSREAQLPSTRYRSLGVSLSFP